LTESALDVELCEKLVVRAASGDAAAGRALVEQLWPVWVEMVRASRSLGERSCTEDDIHDIVAKLVEKFSRADGRTLKLFAPWSARNPGKTFADWMRIVTKNAVRDFVRKKLGPRPQTPGEPSRKRLLNEFASSPLLEELGVRPPLTAAQTARELLEFAGARLSTPELRALAAWLEGSSFDEIADAERLSPDEARKVVRAAIATLRRHFAPATASESTD
jgi:DNA-directed RNA polymerase specialized sigma24 family protein